MDEHGDEQKQDEQREAEAWRGRRKYAFLSAELIGTFLLTVVDAGGAVIGALHGDQVTSTSRGLAAGLVVMCLTFALSNVSGAHFNPAITFGFWARGDFPGRRVVAYWGFQLLGGLLAALFLVSLFGHAGDVGATLPGGTVWQVLAMETFLSCLRVFVVLGVATRHKLLGPTAPLASGGTVALCELFARPISGASENPARSFGPLLLSGHVDVAWMYVAAPLLGAALAVALTALVHPRHHEQEQEAAKGTRSPRPSVM